MEHGRFYKQIYPLYRKTGSRYDAPSSYSLLYNLVRQNVFILGATGNVGRELIKQIAEQDVPELKRHKNPTVVVGLADSQHIAISTGGFSQEFLQRFASTKQRVGEVMGAEKHGPEGINILQTMEGTGYGEDLVYVDATGEKETARNLHLDIIRHTKSQIATANKNPVGLYDYDTYKELTKDPTRYQYSATAMAGLGAVPWLSERNTIGDRIHRIDASLSGTLGFITDAMSRGMKLSDAIMEAKKRGYTEPDFRDDLNGIDVARKLTILAREAGFPIGYNDISITPFLPEDYFMIADPQDCLDQIRENLDEFYDMNAKSTLESHSQTYRYLASLKWCDNNHKPELKVGTEAVSLESPFARLRGTDNFIQVVTDMYTEAKPYRLQGPGAGLDITASVLRRDLLRLQSSIARF